MKAWCLFPPTGALQFQDLDSTFATFTPSSARGRRVRSMEAGDLIIVSAEIEALLDRCRRLIYQADNPIVRAKTGADERRTLVRDLELRLDDTLLTSLARTFPDATIFSSAREHDSKLLN